MQRRLRAGPFVLALMCAGALVLDPSTGFAQPLAQTPNAPPHQSHRFFDACTIASTAAETAALVADGIYTQRGLTRYPNRFTETDPVARPFVSRGWSGQVVGGVIFIGADLGIRYILHRTDHHRVERWIPTFLISYGVIGAIH